MVNATTAIANVLALRAYACLVTATSATCTRFAFVPWSLVANLDRESSNNLLLSRLVLPSSRSPPAQLPLSPEMAGPGGIIDLRGFLAGGAPPPDPAEGAAADPGDGDVGAAVQPLLPGGPGPAEDASADRGPPLHVEGAEGEPDPARRAAFDGDPEVLPAHPPLPARPLAAAEG